MLTAYDGQSASYVGGNLAGDGRWDYSWSRGTQLAFMASLSGGGLWRFTYNADGLRTKRTNGTTTYNYVYNGSQLSQLTIDTVANTGTTVTRTLYFTYDASGTPLSVTYNGTAYYYVTNLQGDVIAILDGSGSEVVTYIYDAWGNLVNIDGALSPTLGEFNPLRYRGYVYDEETGLYYLQSRYYNPKWGRFITADSIEYLGADGTVASHNLFAYCSNNSVKYKQISASLGTQSANALLPAGGTAINLSSIGAITFRAITSGNSVYALRKSSDFKLFGYELRNSAGWNNSSFWASGLLGRIGISSFITHTRGQSGALYAFAGSTLDTMNWFGKTYYAGLGINLFDAIGFEFQLETVGIGGQINIDNFSISANANLIGGSSLTFGWDTNLGKGLTRTDAFTVEGNTGLMLAAIVWMYKVATTGDISLVPGFARA